MPRGIATKTPERVAEAERLRDEGWAYKDIAARLGVKTSTVHAWLSDPDGRQLRARKDSYVAVCPECGGPMSGSNGNRNPKHCAACATVWTPEAVATAIRDWADEHGGVPPTQPCWAPGHPGAKDWMRAEYASGRWPHSRLVSRVFGTWNAALVAAGFEPHSVKGRTPDLDTLIAQIRAGERVEDIAERYGVVPTAINQRFRYAGLRLSDFRPKTRP